MHLAWMTKPPTNTVAIAMVQMPATNPDRTERVRAEDRLEEKTIEITR
jgi:hypothetical protein